MSERASLEATPPALIADRLVRTTDGRWLDLASNQTVAIVDATESPLSVAAWQLRCAERVGLWHSHLVSLVDYAIAPLDGALRRLEIAGSGGDGRAAAWVDRAVASFLAEAAPELASELAAREESARWRWLRHDPRGRPGRAVGVRLVAPDWLDAVIEAATSSTRGPRTAPVHGPPGSGLTTILRAVAREVRRRGIVPINLAALAGDAIAHAVAGRTVVVIVGPEETGATPSLASALARLWRVDARVSLIVAARRAAWPARATRARVLTLPLLTPSQLARQLAFFPARSPARVRRAIERADALPGRVIADWLTTPSLPAAARRGHEGYRDRLSSPAVADCSADVWRVADATHPLIASSGEVRFDAALDGADALPVAWAALRRARVDDARRGFAGLLTAASRSHSADVRAQALWGLGLCAIDEARPDEGERWLRAALAVVAIEPVAAATDAEAIGLSLVRSLCWQSRAVEAHAWSTALGETRPRSWRSCRLQARIEAGRGRLAAALEWLKRAREAACGDGDGVAAVHGDLARLYLAHGDRRGAAAHLAEACRAALHVRSRARWQRLRLIRLQLIVTQSRDREAARLAARRLLHGAVPPLVRLRAARALECVGWRRERAVQGFVERWGEAALWPAPVGEMAMVSDLRTVLEICRDTDEPLPALERVCQCVRDRLRALSVAVHGAPYDRGRLALSGPIKPAATALARRLLESGVAARPTPGDAGVEAGVPVTYAGRTIGAMVCRWPLDTVVDAADAEALLVTAATALAPHVQGVLDADRQRRATAGDTLGLLGAGPAIALLRDQVRRAAQAPFHVLIEGESGSGKELVARAVHHAGPRSHRRFCALNCAALADDLIEAELFGHARGAFTGAIGERAGLFEDADGGTLFLDEVGELSPRAQAKLLRVIQDGEVRRVGENLPRRVDARLVAATNRQLRDEAAAGRFRADLLYRLDVVRLVVPPLRERPEDIALLARTFWQDAAARLGSRATLHPDTLAALARYHWPGNVRELQNVIMALAVNAPSRGIVSSARLPPALIGVPGGDAALTLDAARRSFEQRFVRMALARAGHRPGRAARELGLTRQGLRKLLLRLRIDPLPGDVADSPAAPASPRLGAPLRRSDAAVTAERPRRARRGAAGESGR